ncbi:proton-coupled folate transporter-like isoform X1 [Amphibalanus amphitrite]|uniref:proton-coupled folate transporter-like isoform X1 n=1 Tax=Amphibalanus amphitrite TaxID=1232801 RepID=UPI001C900087|nr:proton-coupled folate transporter-like isoform X1 [Amphibalanus amphitrite]
MSLVSAARRLAASVTVEPVLLLFMVGSYMQYTAMQSLVYAKTCQGLFSPTVCNNLQLDEYSAERDAVQDGASYWMLYSNVALAVPSVISGIYLGTWSDVFGRKAPLLLPPLGQVLAALVYMAMSAYDSVPVGFNVLANLLAGLLGGFSSMIMCCMSYLSAVTVTRQRTTRVSVLESMSFLGGFIGPFVGSAIFEGAGRTWNFTALVIVNSAIVLYVVIRVPEVPPPRQPPAGGSACQKLARVFSLRYLWDAVRVAFKPRADSGRRYILMLLVVAFIIMINTFGVNDVTYLYLSDKPLSVRDATYSGYFAFNHAAGSVALIVGMPLCRRFFDLRDTTLSALGIISKILGLIWLGFTVNVGVLFCVPVVSMVSTFCIPPIRSLLSKLVEADEQGRVFSLLMVAESLCSVLGSALYNSVYPATRGWLHGLVFLLGAATLLLPAGLLYYVHRRLRSGAVERVQPPAAGDREQLAGTDTAPATEEAPPPPPPPGLAAVPAAL